MPSACFSCNSIFRPKNYACCLVLYEAAQGCSLVLYILNELCNNQMGSYMVVRLMLPKRAIMPSDIPGMLLEVAEQTIQSPKSSVTDRRWLLVGG